jgi:uncharacterized protein YhbP (UPF0306 family)
MKKDFEWKKYLLECMNSTDYCSVATVDPKGTWSNPVYFAWDEQFNFYFMSQPNVRHMQNIKKDGRVSVSIYATNQTGFVKGIQLEGKAHVIENDDERSSPADENDEFFSAYKAYYQRLGEFKEGEAIVVDNEWSFVKIIPDNIYYFNNEIFGEERKEVPRNELA